VVVPIRSSAAHFHTFHAPQTTHSKFKKTMHIMQHQIILLTVKPPETNQSTPLILKPYSEIVSVTHNTHPTTKTK
jgi:hypothetical protein